MKLKTNMTLKTCFGLNQTARVTREEQLEKSTVCTKNLLITSTMKANRLRYWVMQKEPEESHQTKLAGLKAIDGIRLMERAMQRQSDNMQEDLRNVGVDNWRGKVGTDMTVDRVQLE